MFPYLLSRSSTSCHCLLPFPGGHSNFPLNPELGGLTVYVCVSMWDMSIFVMIAFLSLHSEEFVIIRRR